MAKLLVSFGFRHGGPDSAEGDIIDVRRWFHKNPYHVRELRKLRGTDEAVQDEIRKTPQFEDCLNALSTRVHDSPNDIVFLGCTGGHHRSVYLAVLIGQRFGYDVMHRDIDKP